MPTLQDVTREHSRRLSDIHRLRDHDVAEAVAARDAHLRALPAAARAYAKYDADLADAREKQGQLVGKAEAARTSALIAAIDRRTDQLESAQEARRSTDEAALAARRLAEEEAERRFRDAVSNLEPATPLTTRQKTLRDASLARTAEIEAAKRVHADTIGTSQMHYRSAVEEAIVDERHAARDAERDYDAAVRLAEGAFRPSLVSVDQSLSRRSKASPTPGRSWSTFSETSPPFMLGRRHWSGKNSNASAASSNRSAADRALTSRSPDPS